MTWDAMTRTEQPKPWYRFNVERSVLLKAGHEWMCYRGSDFEGFKTFATWAEAFAYAFDKASNGVVA